MGRCPAGHCGLGEVASADCLESRWGQEKGVGAREQQIETGPDYYKHASMGSPPLVLPCPPSLSSWTPAWHRKWWKHVGALHQQIMNDSAHGLGTDKRP